MRNNKEVWANKCYIAESQAKSQQSSIVDKKAVVLDELLVIPPKHSQKQGRLFSWNFSAALLPHYHCLHALHLATAVALVQVVLNV